MVRFFRWLYQPRVSPRIASIDPRTGYGWYWGEIQHGNRTVTWSLCSYVRTKVFWSSASDVTLGAVTPLRKVVSIVLEGRLRLSSALFSTVSVWSKNLSSLWSVEVSSFDWARAFFKTSYTSCVSWYRSHSAGRNGLAGWSLMSETWLILPVVICLSQRLSHACLSISTLTAKLRKAH